MACCAFIPGSDLHAATEEQRSRDHSPINGTVRFRTNG
jgi:hypothetical protein